MSESLSDIFNERKEVLQEITDLIDLLDEDEFQSFEREEKALNFCKDYTSMIEEIIKNTRDVFHNSIKIQNMRETIDLRQQMLIEETKSAIKEEESKKATILETLNEEKEKSQYMMDEIIAFKKKCISPIIICLNSIFESERKTSQLFQSMKEKMKSNPENNEKLSFALSDLLTILDHIETDNEEILLNSLDMLTKMAASSLIRTKIEEFIDDTNYSFPLQLIEIFHSKEDNRRVLLHMILKLMNELIQSKNMVIISIRDGFLQFISDFCIPLDESEYQDEDNTFIIRILDEMLSMNYIKTIEKFGKEAIIKLSLKSPEIETERIKKKISVIENSFRDKNKKVINRFSNLRVYP